MIELVVGLGVFMILCGVIIGVIAIDQIRQFKDRDRG